MLQSNRLIAAIAPVESNRLFEKRLIDNECLAGTRPKLKTLKQIQLPKNKKDEVLADQEWDSL